MIELDRILSRLHNIPVALRSAQQFYLDEGYDRTMIDRAHPFGLDILFRMISPDSYHRTFRGRAQLAQSRERETVFAMHVSILISLPANATLTKIVEELQTKYRGWVNRRL